MRNTCSSRRTLRSVALMAWLEARSWPSGFSSTTLETTASETRLERVPVQVNFRHDKLDHIVTEQWLADPSFEVEGTPEVLQGKRAELTFLQRWAKHLKAGRELGRANPENFNRPDYNFRPIANPGSQPPA